MSNQAQDFMRNHYGHQASNTNMIYQMGRRNLSRGGQANKQGIPQSPGIFPAAPVA